MRIGLFCTTLFLICFTVISFAANTTYTIQQGDTLYDIARRHDTSVSKIKQLNNLQSNNLKIGSSILVPSNIVTYTIKSGDTLGTIAQKYGLNSSKEIIEFNGLSSSFVKVGQTIRIPSTKAVNTASKTTAPVSGPTKDIVVKKEKKILKSSHTVKSGDSLYSIALKNGTTVDSIKELNNLDSNNLQIGQVLVLTDSAPIQKPAVVKTAKKEVVVETTGPSNIYKVKSGDTLGQIAEDHGVRTKDLKKHNGLENNNLKIGQLLTIPSGTHSIIIVEKPKSLDPEINPVKPAPAVVSKTSGIKLPVVEKPQQAKVQKQVSFPVSGQSEPEVTEAPVQENKYHYVTSGETLGHIAVLYDLESSKTIIEANGLENSNLKIGQKLLIPTSGTTKVVARSDSSPAVKSNQKNKKIPQPAVEKKIDKDTYTGTYRVRSGDTVSQIAEKFNIKTADLKSANGLRNNNIRVGQKLSVPKTTSNLVTSSKKKTQTYTVKKGDTLIGIARKFNVNVKTLKQYNNLSSSRLDVGDKIKVPGSSLTVTKSGDIQYKVVKGDSLLKIANNFNISVSSLKSANGLRSNRIDVGDRLIIPPTNAVKSSSKSRTKVAKSSKSSKNDTIINYRVRGGDTLSSIARKHNSSVTKIKQANNLYGNSIYSGQKLKVPSKIYASSKKSSKPKKSFRNEEELQDELIKVAKKYLGAPYKFGGNSTRTGIDCSAYVKKIFKSFDVNLPRTARGMYKKGDHVSKSKLQKGDLVFFRTYAKFPSHVGIYMGNGKFIHASSAKKKVIITNFQGKYYQKRYIGAKRIKIKNSYAKNLDN